MQRIQMVQNYIDKVIENLPLEIDKKYGYMHLYGVSQACAMIAMKRNLDVELATIAGLLHDIYSYKAYTTLDHAHKGAEMAKDIMQSLKVFNQKEIELVCHAIYVHSDKHLIHTPFDECLKDGDVLQHCLYNPLANPSRHEKERFEALKQEFCV
ncbi:MAG: HD domain-containing protein [Firmicutes bacterium]|nr:HD domain-containing protein [Bacillota bacterium]